MLESQLQVLRNINKLNAREEVVVDEEEDEHEAHVNGDDDADLSNGPVDLLSEMSYYLDENKKSQLVIYYNKAYYKARLWETGLDVLLSDVEGKENEVKDDDGSGPYIPSLKSQIKRGIIAGHSVPGRPPCISPEEWEAGEQ